MNSMLVIFILASIPACIALRCYNCGSGLTGCNDPFSENAANVTITSSSSDIYCVKKGYTSSLVVRYGSSSCDSSTFYFGVGTACCTTDLCNGAGTTYPMAIMVALTSILMLMKFY